MSKQKGNEVKFPHVTVQLTGEDGNAFGILGRVERALRRAGVDREAINEYRKAATSSDFDNLLQVTMNTVEVR